MRRTKSKEMWKSDSPWTKAEIKWFIKMYPATANDVIITKLHRTTPAIQNMAYRLGLKKNYSDNIKRYRMGNECWSKDEIQFLKQSYQTSTYEEIAKQLGRSEGAVRDRASILRLTKNSLWTKKEIDFVRKKFSTMECTEIAVRLGRTTGGVWKVIRNLKLARKKVLDWTDEERDFLRKNFSKRTYHWLAEHLNRPIRGVRKQAWKLGLNTRSR